MAQSRNSSTIILDLCGVLRGSKEDALRTRYARTHEALGEHSRPLPPLQPGDRVYLQNQVVILRKKGTEAVLSLRAEIMNNTS